MASFLSTRVVVGAATLILLGTVSIQASQSEAAASPVVHVYSFGGKLHAFSTEHAVASTVLGFWAPLKIHADGTVSGTGAITYEWALPCKWEAPAPVDGNNCTLIGVTDGAFTVSGRVLETVHRHNEDHPYKDAAFELLDFHAGDDANDLDRAGEAPLTLALTMAPTALPGEHLKIYGLSGGNVEERAGGMSALAMDGSNAFFREFTILAIANTSTAGGDLEQFRSAGRYRHGAEVFGTGVFSLYMIDPSRLPGRSSPSLLADHEDGAPVPRELLDYEQKAIEAYEENGHLPPRSAFDDVAEGYLDLLTSLPLGAGGVDPYRASGVGLTDDTRPKSN